VRHPPSLAANWGTGQPERMSGEKDGEIRIREDKEKGEREKVLGVGAAAQKKLWSQVVVSPGTKRALLIPVWTYIRD